MKKLFALAAFLLINFIGYSQAESINNNNKSGSGKNEIKINVPYLLFGAPEITYERIINEDTAVGISGAIYIEGENRNIFHVMPYYRLYFGKKLASGFFIEGNGAIFLQEPYESYYYENDTSFVEENNNQLGIGLGFATGVKFMVKKDWLIEIYGGLGRNFLNNDLIDIAYPRLGVTLGKRF